MCLLEARRPRVAAQPHVGVADAVQDLHAPTEHVSFTSYYCARPLMSFINVVFPLPLGPTSHDISPQHKVKLTCETSMRPLYVRKLTLVARTSTFPTEGLIRFQVDAEARKGRLARETFFVDPRLFLLSLPRPGPNSESFSCSASVKALWWLESRVTVSTFSCFLLLLLGVKVPMVLGVDAPELA